MPAKAKPQSTAATPEKAMPPADAVREVVKWVLNGHAEADIIEAIAQKFPTADSKPLILSALSQLAEAGQTDPAMIRGFAIEATREIFRKSLEVGDHQVALRALKQLTELAG